mmetsp:Transcript_33072/g.54705  ORF Transcript_33072/g.54705 Transcript_33072/m.54705 type:complete len:82 (-) Transcript_33072:11-256(-)
MVQQRRLHHRLRCRSLTKKPFGIWMSMQKQYAMATKSRQYQPHGRTLQQMVAMLAWAAAANKVRVVISLQYDDDDDVILFM